MIGAINPTVVVRQEETGDCDWKYVSGSLVAWQHIAGKGRVWWHDIDNIRLLAEMHNINIVTV